jgi:hypothetical protein
MTGPSPWLEVLPIDFSSTTAFGIDKGTPGLASTSLADAIRL